MEVNDTSFIGISTPEGEDNWVSRLIATKDKENGDEPYFRTKRIILICDNCMKLEDLAKKSLCNHMDHLLPKWKSADKHKKFAKMTAEIGDPGRGLKENSGIVVDNQNKIFKREQINTVFNMQHLLDTLDPPPSRIFVAIDPDAGGKSTTSIVSGYPVFDKVDKDLISGFVVTGIECKRTENHLIQNKFVEDHIIRLRNYVKFKDARIILIPENQTGYFHTRIEECGANHYNVMTLYQGGLSSKKPGVCKTPFITADYVTCALSNLDKVYFDKIIRTICPDYNTHVLELKTQMIRYERDEKGKITGKTGGFNDDLCIAFLMFLYWTRAVERNWLKNPYNYLK
jgi:hypothetical protein